MEQAEQRQILESIARDEQTYPRDRIAAIKALREIDKPAAEEAGAPWAGFHALRHTCASMLFDEGRNIRQVQQWLGHHAPSFTLDTYVHLLDEGIGDGLQLPVAGRPRRSRVDHSGNGGRTPVPLQIGQIGPLLSQPL